MNTNQNASIGGVEGSQSSEATAVHDALEGSNLPDVPALDPHPVRDDIAKLRCNLPFVSIVPFPRSSFIVSLAANVTGEIRIPDNAVLMRLDGAVVESIDPLSAPGFFMTDKGAANGNTSAQEATNGNNQFSADVFIAGRTADWIYCAQMKTVSVRNPNAGQMVIGARFIFRDEI